MINNSIIYQKKNQKLFFYTIVIIIINITVILDLYTKNKVFNLLISPNLNTYLFGTDSKVLKFNKVHMRTHRRSG